MSLKFKIYLLVICVLNLCIAIHNILENNEPLSIAGIILVSIGLGMVASTFLKNKSNSQK